MHDLAACSFMHTQGHLDYLWVQQLSPFGHKICYIYGSGQFAKFDSGGSSALCQSWSGGLNLASNSQNYF